MTKKQVALIQSSWKLATPFAQELGEVFYARLFELYPKVRPLFKSDMTLQIQKLMATLDAVVKNLENLGEITQDIKALAIRHKEYGTQPEHYAAVGDCLLWALEKKLGKDWNLTLKEAWISAYVFLSTTMIEAQNTK